MSTPNRFHKPTDAEISHERLLELVSYDPATGHFCNRAGRGGTRPGSPLGHVESNGYRRIMVAGHRYFAHRLAWFYMTGGWPPAVVDHKNVCPDDNRWKNLRLATRSQNQANQRKRSGTMSPLKGAHWNRFRGYWQSYIRVGGKSVFLGRFDAPEDAHAAYVAAAAEHFGEFGRAA